MKKKIVYRTYEEDVITNWGQNIDLPESYSWVDNSLKNKILSKVIYWLADVFAAIYSKWILRIEVVGREKLSKRGTKGFYVYGNHTQMIGDAFVPIYVFRGSRMRAIVSTANLGIPVLGKILPCMGALPVPGFDQMKKFLKAVEYYADIGNGIVIYPEAHVWPYYTRIRPFGTAAFSYPVKQGLPVYCMTTTYQKPKHGEKPTIRIYIDGPMESDKNQAASKQKKELCQKVHQCMEKRSWNSDYEYWKYEEER